MLTLRNVRRRIATLAVAAFIAASAAALPMLIDGSAGTSMTPAALAGDPCHGNGGG